MSGSVFDTKSHDSRGHIGERIRKRSFESSLLSSLDSARKTHFQKSRETDVDILFLFDSLQLGTYFDLGIEESDASFRECIDDHVPLE